MSTAAINRLPLELLTETLTLTLPEPDIRNTVQLRPPSGIERLHPNNFLCVCRHWRYVVLSTQRLWTHLSITVTIRCEVDARTAIRLLQRCLDCSGHLPLSLCLVITVEFDEASGAVKELERTVTRSQRRWGRATICTPWESPISVDQLAASPIRELTLFGNKSPFPTPGVGLVLDKLTVLCLRSCHPSYTSLSKCTPNLQSLTIRDWRVKEHQWRPQHHWDPLPLYFERLQTLCIDVATTLDHLSCPSLRHLYTLDITSDRTLSFLERSNYPPLQSFKIVITKYRAHRSVRASDTLIALRHSPFLLTLDLTTDFDRRFYEEMAARDLDSGACVLCPLLQEVTLGERRHFGEDLDALAQFVRSRWRAPCTALKSVHLRRSPIGYKDGDDLQSLTGPWEPIARCIAEGLHFTASQSPMFRSRSSTG